MTVTLLSGKQAKSLHCGIFGVIAKLVDDLGPEYGSPYVAFVVERCIHFFKRLELGSVKTATFNPVLVILEWNTSIVRRLSMDASGMACAYQRELSRNKSLSPTIKGGLLQVLHQFFLGLGTLEVSWFLWFESRIFLAWLVRTHAQCRLCQILGRLLEVFAESFAEDASFNGSWLQDECIVVLEKAKRETVTDAYVSGALLGLAATILHMV